MTKSPKRINYLNNRDILKEIHKSKATFCSYVDSDHDHQFDIVLLGLSKINMRTIAEARRNRAARITKETGTPVDEKTIPNTDLVFRVMTFEHIPIDPKPKKKKSTARTKTIDLAEILDEVEVEEDNNDLETSARDPSVILYEKHKDHVRVNFPPFFHYRITDHKVPYIVGKSHWLGGMENGYFSKDHGAMTNKLALMFIKLCERYATRSNWRGYTYNEEMRGQALLQLSQIGLQFDEGKSSNPFAYYTAAITNSFTRVLNIEKRNQNIRDDILEMNGLNPSWTRTNAEYYKKIAETGTDTVDAKKPAASSTAK